ncbi:MAG: nucleotidyltransferase domain-containing protein [Caldilinea sp.]|nr:nucleotidyltransferase domain-containing protein [Caldilinea sp.]MDW8439677.1 nucleotidyltransferase domain-containing protein [Caldilineaceae bacterium]
MTQPADLTARRAAYVAALNDALQRILAQLRRRPEVERVILFGSYAAGRKDLFTDLDLLVVMESTEDFLTRTARLRQDLTASVDLDLLVYTPEEFTQMHDRGFLRHILATGQVLYERERAAGG